MGAVTVGKRQAEETAGAYAADFEGFYAARRPEPCPDGHAVLLTCDGSAFPVLPSALRPATAKAAAARAKAKEEQGWPDDPGDLRKSRKRTAELAAVADIPPAPRTPQDVLGALFGPARPGKEEAPKPDPGPRAQGKTLFASAARPAAGVIADAFAEAHRRDPEHRRPWIAVIDGNCHQIETVEKLAGEYRVQVTILTDLIHVSTSGRRRDRSSTPANPRPGTGPASRRPRSWRESTATSAPGSAAAQPRSGSAAPNGPARNSAPATCRTSRTT